MPTTTIETPVSETRFQRRVAKELSFWWRQQGVHPSHVLTRFVATTGDRVYSGPFPLSGRPGEPAAPFALVGLRGPVGVRLLVAVWVLAAAGIAFKLFFTGRLRLLSTLMYVAMGWLVVLEWRPVVAALDPWTLRWLLAGGVVYTLGTLFYHRPRLRYAHAIWHLFVIGGGACHYVAVLAQATSR